MFFAPCHCYKSGRIQVVYSCITMDPLAALSRISGGEYTTIRNIGTLTPNKEYVLKKLRKLNTINGPVIVADLEDLSIFLPKRFTNLSESVINEITSDSKILLVYRGLESIGGGNKTIHKVDFKRSE